MAFKKFLDLKVGDKVVCLDEYSGGTSYHKLVINEIEDDSEYATESYRQTIFWNRPSLFR